MSRLWLKIGISVVLTAMLSLSGCAGISSVSQHSAEDIRFRAEDYIIDKQYSEAAIELEMAVSLAPQNSDHALRYGEILEVLTRWQDARSCYQNALSELPTKHPRRSELSYRLALLALFKLNDPQAVTTLTQQLPIDTPRYYDIQGILATRMKSPREALTLFNRGLAAKPNKEVAARILQHATDAYVALNETEKAFGTLFNAINLADQKPALSQDIEADWNALKEKYGEY
jgi:tetratricopeptide (TPR) repeat protein